MLIDRHWQADPDSLAITIDAFGSGLMRPWGPFAACASSTVTGAASSENCASSLCLQVRDRHGFGKGLTSWDLTCSYQQHCINDDVLWMGNKEVAMYKEGPCTALPHDRWHLPRVKWCN